MKSYHVLVGNSIDYISTNTSTFYCENIDPALLTPANIYLAQMAYRKKALADLVGSFPSPPLAPEVTGDVRLLDPTDDVTVGQDPESISIPFEGYLQFDMSLGLDQRSSECHYPSYPPAFHQGPDKYYLYHVSIPRCRR